MSWHALALLWLLAHDPYQQARAAMEAAAARQRQAIEAMQEALARQRASVQAQAAGWQGAQDGFFVTPWLQPLVEPASGAAQESPCEPVSEEELGALVNEVAQREGLTPDLLRAVIEKESSRLPCAVSPKGAQGLMQLMPATALELGVRDPFDPAENVSAGARLLRRLLARYGGDLALALGAYNAGPAWIDAFGTLPPFRETWDYVSAILGKLRSPSQGPR
ncbi:MAG: lytic transglycosylase domain-containing protein [Bryobacterales bacterium]|nr:lytic transglycosylase domain-containing protein [Bryobacteraceae bacterium]MDW8129877.1 lytic transglycosylase domain-containing protein [Bryobacterales bacterium]